MTSDEQEALSRVYYARRVLRLSSGRYAVFALNCTRVEIVDDPRECDLDFHPATSMPKRRYSMAAVLDQIIKNL